MRFKFDLKLVFLALLVLCLVLEAQSWHGRRSRGGSRGVRRSGRSWRGRSRFRSVSRRFRSGRRSVRRYGRRIARRYRRIRSGRRSVRRYGRRYGRRTARRYRRIRSGRRSVRRYERRYGRRTARRYRRIRSGRRSVRRYGRRYGRRYARRYRRIRSGRRSVRRYGRRTARRYRRTRQRPRPRPHTHKTKSALRRLYNSKVVSVQRFKRPLGGLLGHLGIKHSGVVVTTRSGKKYLIHKGKGYGVKGQTVVVEAKYMSKKWKASTKVLPVKPGTNIGKFVKTGGKGYNFLFNNCHHASKAMCKLG